MHTDARGSSESVTVPDCVVNGSGVGMRNRKRNESRRRENPRNSRSPTTTFGVETCLEAGYASGVNVPRSTPRLRASATAASTRVMMLLEANGTAAGRDTIPTTVCGVV